MGKKSKRSSRQKQIMKEVARMDAIHRHQSVKKRGIFQSMIYSGKKAVTH